MNRLRPAIAADLPALRTLIPLSVRALSRGHYTERQIESAIRHVFGPDTQLIDDGTYFVVEDEGGAFTGCGGWSRRRTLFGGDQMKGTALAPTDDLLDPAAEPARIRAFFVHPGYARKGLGSLILRACLEAARAAGFTHAELAATLPGVPFYRRRGFGDERPFTTTLPDATEIAFVQMSATLDR